MGIDCCILLLSCDKHLDVVQTHLQFLEKYWSNCPFQIYIGVEKASFIYNGPLMVKILNSSNVLWAGRVIEYLNYVPFEKVMVTLDDFFVEEKVLTESIFESIKVIDKNPQIANIAFVHFIGKKVEKKAIGSLECRVKNSLCLMNWQIGVWNKVALLSLLKEFENPWESELFGSLRARYISKYDFYCIDDEKDMPIKYGHGWLIVRGKWNSKEIDRIEKKCKIEIHPSNRPVDEITKIDISFKDRAITKIRLMHYRLKLIITELMKEGV